MGGNGGTAEGITVDTIFLSTILNNVVSTIIAGDGGNSTLLGGIGGDAAGIVLGEGECVQIARNTIDRITAGRGGSSPLSLLILPSNGLATDLDLPTNTTCMLPSLSCLTLP